MKTVNVAYDVYEFKELKPEMKEKVISKWYENEDYPFLEEDLTELCLELLAENKIKKNDFAIEYSLSYSQGDGLNFTGNFEWKKYRVIITHSWRYSSASSSEITLVNEDEEEITEGKDYDDFKSIYLDICKKAEKHGYKIIEYRMNEDEFNELCESNGYNFDASGKMMNL